MSQQWPDNLSEEESIGLTVISKNRVNLEETLRK